MRTSNGPISAVARPLLAIVLAFAIASPVTFAATHSGRRYAYATAGITDQIHAGGVDWKILLDESNLGGSELDLVEATFPAGMRTPSHTHKSVEIIYVLAGIYEHEVNGKLYRLTPGMIGIVRPGDHVRHIVPKSGPAKVLIIWAPAGEIQRDFRHEHGVAIPPLEPVKTAVPAL